MFCVGITGNIGSGKSTAISFFDALGMSVINADKISKDLTQAGKPAFLQIRDHFGESVVNQDGELNRPLLRQLVFSDTNQRLWLEKLLHPLIRESIKEQVSRATSPYCVIEIPLLSKRADYPYLDRIVVMIADKDKQIARVMQRDNCTEADALAILSSQPSETLLKELADDLVLNDDSREKLNNKLMKLHDKYLHLAVKKSS